MVSAYFVGPRSIGFVSVTNTLTPWESLLVQDQRPMQCGACDAEMTTTALRSARATARPYMSLREAKQPGLLAYGAGSEDMFTGSASVESQKLWLKSRKSTPRFALTLKNTAHLSNRNRVT